MNEIHNLEGAGCTEGSRLDAANMLKLALARGAMQVIGDTTVSIYKQCIENDAALD